MAAREPSVRVRASDQIGKWTIIKCIGHGGYGEIYKVKSPDSRPRTFCAMKVELKTNQRRGLSAEIEILRSLQGSPSFPRLIDVGETEEFHYVVMELLGPSIAIVRRELPEQRFTMLTTTVLAREMLKCLEELHTRGVVHRDVKPGNFLFRYGDKSHMICLIDFGLARHYIDRTSGAPLPPRRSPGFVGTCSFASVYAHDGMDLSRRDDIISWLYTIVECVEKRLPWPGSRNRDQTFQMKKEMTVSQLCRALPRQFIPIFQRTMKMSYYDKPDYDMFYGWLDEAIEELGGRGVRFDWELILTKRPSFMGLPHSIDTDHDPGAEDCLPESASFDGMVDAESHAFGMSDQPPHPGGDADQESPGPPRRRVSPRVNRHSHDNEGMCCVAA